MRQVRRLAYRTRHALRKPPPPRWQRPTRAALLLVTCAGLLAASHHLAERSGLIERARFAVGDQLIALSDGMGMAVADIFTEGRQRTSAAEIFRILEPYYGQNILAVDIGAIQQRLQSLPWVRRATVSRQLPDRLVTNLVEHRPLALWYGAPALAPLPESAPALGGLAPRATGTALVSDRGDIIRIDAVTPWRHLPILSGADAPAAAPELMRLIETEPALARKVTGAERVDGRRWNVFVDGRIEVRLPEHEPAAAWARLARLDAEERLLARAVDAIDLRLDDRVIVRLADELFEPATAIPATAARMGQPT